MSKMMVTWLGEDDQHFEILYDENGREQERRPVPGPSFTYMGAGPNAIRFDKDKPVLIDSEAAGLSADRKLLVDNILKRAPSMKARFKVEPVQEKGKHGDIRDAR
jgi:hypothetical protein